MGLKGESFEKESSLVEITIDEIQVAMDAVNGFTKSMGEYWLIARGGGIGNSKVLI